MPVPSDPRAFRYEPRALVDNARQFGKTNLALKPASGVDPSDPRFLAAQVQHRVANAAREGMLAHGASLKSYAEALRAPGMSYDRLVRIQRGETLMQLADLVNWAQHFENVADLLATRGTWPALCESAGEGTVSFV